MLFFNKQKRGIVNVKMIITEEKILSNIDKVKKLINPNSKKQIVQLEEDAFFKDLIDSIKVYLIEYPNKKNFPASVYKGAHELVEYATNEFEDNTKQKISGVFVAVGTASSTDIARKIGARIENNNIVVNENMETTVPGLFACGDCTGGLLQISKAIYEGTKAGLAVLK